MTEAQTTPQSAPLAGAVETSLLDQIVTEGRVGRNTEERERARTQVQAFLDAVLKGAVTVDRDTETALNAYIAQIDRLLSVQLDTILHRPDFQKLEATWRGLKYLLSQSETSDQLKIKIFNVSKKELLRDLRRAPEFDQSTLFKKVYEEEFGTFGGAPFATLIGDYSFGRSPEDL
jgi:type VI secretion system protein ImpC